MYKDLSISVVIPCYNEEKGVEATIRLLPNFVDEIIVIDNNSTDRTAEVAENLGARVIYEGRQGYGRAYKTGLRYAKGDIIVTMDGDATYPAVAIPYLIDVLLLDKLDFISAARIPQDLSKTWNNIQRYYGNMGLTFIVWAVFGVRLQDSQSGMWVFRKNILETIIAKSDGMPFSEELKVRAFLHHSIKTKEIPIHFRYIERIGPSKLNLWKDGLKNIGYLFKLKYCSDLMM